MEGVFVHTPLHIPHPPIAYSMNVCMHAVLHFVQPAGLASDSRVASRASHGAVAVSQLGGDGWARPREQTQP